MSRVLLPAFSRWICGLPSVAASGAAAAEKIVASGGLGGRRWCSHKNNRPLSANELPRPAGISSMYRLPVVTSTQGKGFKDLWLGVGGADCGVYEETFILNCLNHWGMRLLARG